MQNKEAEIQFFNDFAIDEGDYNVFTEETRDKIIQTCVEAGGFKAGDKVADLGCGSGAFTVLLQRNHDIKPVGLDISDRLIRYAQREYPEVEFMVGDVEQQPFDDNSMDGALLSGIVHHFPDPTKFAEEVYRVLKPGAAFVAFDPNRMNPFFYLYRDKSSPFYSQVGVTENERPIIAKRTAEVFEDIGFDVSVSYLGGLNYRYIASPLMRTFLPMYNTLDNLLFSPGFMKPYRQFVITVGRKKA
ncbi:MAG: class I SAM-dependent methyltransferase [Chloroflexota bacterium]